MGGPHAAGGHAAHGQGPPGEPFGQAAAQPAEEFPRHLLTDLVGAEERAERRRLARAEWVLGLALASFALAFPLEALVGRGPEWAAGLAGGKASGPHLVPSLLGGWLGRAGLGFERAGYLLSALSLALCLPLAGTLGRRLGAPPRLASLGALTLVLSPAAWNAGSLPGPGAAGMAAALALCTALLDPGRSRRLLALALLAPLVDLLLVWLLPAVLVAARGTGRPGAALRSLGLVGGAATGLALIHLLAAALDPARGLAELGPELGRAALGRDFHPAPLAWTALPGPLALGLGLGGLLSLVAVRRGPEESGPPPWLWAWCLVPLVPWALGPLPLLILLGPALLGGLDLLARAPEARALRVLAAIVGIQTALVVGGRAALGSADPLAAWRAAAEAEFRAGDALMSADPDRLHLARLRYGLPAIDARVEARGWIEGARHLAAAGHRIWVDGEPGGAPAAPGWHGAFPFRWLRVSGGDADRH